MKKAIAVVCASVCVMSMCGCSSILKKDSTPVKDTTLQSEADSTVRNITFQSDSTVPLTDEEILKRRTDAYSRYTNYIRQKQDENESAIKSIQKAASEVSDDSTNSNNDSDSSDTDYSDSDSDYDNDSYLRHQLR